MFSAVLVGSEQDVELEVVLLCRNWGFSFRLWRHMAMAGAARAHNSGLSFSPFSVVTSFSFIFFFLQI